MHGLCVWSVDVFFFGKLQKTFNYNSCGRKYGSTAARNANDHATKTRLDSVGAQTAVARNKSTTNWHSF